MEISPRKPSKRAQEPADEWLQNEGYFRKHAPRDPTCLFRAVSEQVYLTQHYHIRVRKECVEFMRKNRHLFEQYVTIAFDNYLEQMVCFTEWGGMNEIQAMSLLYEREFVIFNGQKQMRKTVTNNGYKESIYLCYTPQKQYESVYTREFIADAAFCQSIVYQALYKNIFNMSNIESTVYKMLHDRTASFRHDKFFLKGNLEIREQLTTEMYNKIENGVDEVDDAQSIGKSTPPIPYRVAKALDPNIYRNTDFDIWHEIRREVKNAGWTRHNTHELQIGGKCLVQMDFNEPEADRVNNNNVLMYPSEKDSNGNDVKALQQSVKQDTIFFCGHIQEMSKNQGPVIVFIEELGEKRSVPYSALKPLPLRKNKQNNWSPMCKRNVLLDTNTKWKKAGGTNSRKVKDPIDTVLSNNIDKNGNNNNITEVSKNNFGASHWNEDSVVRVQNQQVYENYNAEKPANYMLDNTSTTYSTVSASDNSVTSQQEANKENKTNTSGFANHTSNETVQIKTAKSEITRDSDLQANSPTKERSQKNAYYSACNDGNSYPFVPCSSGNVGQSDTENQTDRILRFINCSAQKSVDVNGGDLPLSDPFTLRFFYNLGLEYFRVSHTWNYTTNGASASFGPLYQGATQGESSIASITNGVVQNCSITQKGEQSNDQREVDTQTAAQEVLNKCTNNMKDTKAYNNENQRNGVVKNPTISNRDVQRVNRNGIAPRFKKNSDIRHRNTYQDQSQQLHNSSQYQYRGSNYNSVKAQDNKVENFTSQCVSSTPQQMHVSAGAPNPCHPPYVQQNIYASLPYYMSEADAFGNPYYLSNPGFFQFPCVPAPDIPDNNNITSFSPHICPGIDFAPTYPGLCSPYICPAPAPYSIPPQNMSEHWYPVPGQPPFMQYAPMVPIPAEATCNIAGQSSAHNTSS